MKIRCAAGHEQPQIFRYLRTQCECGAAIVSITFGGDVSAENDSFDRTDTGALGATPDPWRLDRGLRWLY